jgi:hypothetical protein
MALDRLIQILLPHDDTFFSFLEESTKNLLRAAEILKQLPTAAERERESIVRKIHDIEHDGDSTAHKIFAELNTTFVTPFDREDIHRLTSALDDVLDYLDGSATRFVLYKIKECPPGLAKLIEILYDSINELNKGIPLLRDFKKADMLQKVLQKVNEYENEADSVFEIAIAELFEKEKDPIQVIKLKEIYVGLETATDKCEDAANVLEALLIKHT